MTRLSAVAALAAILVLDTVAAARLWPLPVVGLLDEPAHLLTAWLLLAALLPAKRGELRLWALLGAVLIDVDHVPQYLWGVGTATEFGRPVTHSLCFLLMVQALSWPGSRLQVPLRGLSLGIALHLVRDVATGPGLPLLWPVVGTSLLGPYPAYVAVLCLATAGAVLRPGGRRSLPVAPRPHPRDPNSDTPPGTNAYRQ